LTANTGWNFAKDPVGTQEVKTVRKIYNSNYATVTVNMCVYKTTATFSTATWVKVATLPSGYIPTSNIHGEVPGWVSGNQFTSVGDVAFSDDAEYSFTKVFRIKTNGDVEVRIDTVSASATLSGSNYVIFPIVVTYNIEGTLN